MRMRDLLARAREELRYEPIEKRVRASAGDETIVDTTRALLLWEPRRICPIYAVPADDIRAALEPAPTASHEDVPGLLHPGIPFTVHTAAGRAGDGRGRGRLPARRPARLRRRRLRGLRLARGGRARARAPARPVPPRRRPPHLAAGADRARRRPRGREHAVRGWCSRPGSRCASTSRARTSASRCRPARCGRTARTRARRPTSPSTAARTCSGATSSRWRTCGPLAGLLGFWHERFEMQLDGRRHEPREDEIVQVMLEEFGV